MAEYFTAVAVAAELQLPFEGVLASPVTAGATSIQVNFASDSLPAEWAVGRTLALDYMNPVSGESFRIGAIAGDANPFTVSLEAGSSLAFAHSANCPVKDLTPITLQVEPISRWIDRFCNLEDNAFYREAVSGETVYGLIDKDGNILVQAKKAVVESVTAFSYQVSPDTGTITLSDVSRVWIENDYMVKVFASSLTTQTGQLLPRGLSAYRGRKVRCTMSYVGGYHPIPKDLQHAAVILAARWYKSAAQGYSDAVGADTLGSPVFSSKLPREAKETLERLQRVTAFLGR